MKQESILPNIAQLVERLTVEELRRHQAVTGSNPVVRSFFLFLIVFTSDSIEINKLFNLKANLR